MSSICSSIRRYSGGALVAIVVLGACHAPADEAPMRDRLRALVDKGAGEGAFERSRTIIKLSERGCMGCNRSFASLISGHVADTDVVFVIDASGQSVDLSPFFDRKQRTIWDDDGSMRKMGFGESSCAIFLEEGRIDTAIPIRVEDIEERLRFVEARMSE